MRKLISLVILLLITSCSPEVGGGQNERGFLPQQLCEQTEGFWEKVDPLQYPEDIPSGIFSTHPDYNSRCVCPEKTSWTPNGCQ